MFWLFLVGKVVGGQLVDRTANSLAPTARITRGAAYDRYVPMNWRCGQPVARLQMMGDEPSISHIEKAKHIIEPIEGKVVK